MQKRSNKTRKLTVMGVLISVSIVLMLLIRFPLIPAAPFLEYDAMDVPILIGGFLYGPMAGLLMTIISSAIQGLTVSAAIGGPYGLIMHIIASGVFVVVASVIYKKYRHRKGAFIALAVGTLSMALVMIPANLLITPIFMNTDVSVVKEMILPVIVPFNLLKAGINALITFIIYKPLSRWIKREK